MGKQTKPIGHIGSAGFVSVNLQKSFQHLQHSIFGIAWNDFIGGFFSFFSCCVYCISFSGRLNHRNVIQVISKSNRFPIGYIFLPVLSPFRLLALQYQPNTFQKSRILIFLSIYLPQVLCKYSPHFEDDIKSSY